MRFSAPHFLAFLLLLAVELLIARFAHGFVRNFIGDALVVILLYCAVQSFLNLPKFKTITAVFCFAVCVELAQYLQIPSKIGIQPRSTTSVMTGSTFDWLDILAYGVGVLLIGLVLYFKQAKHRPIPNV